MKYDGINIDGAYPEERVQLETRGGEGEEIPHRRKRRKRKVGIPYRKEIMGEEGEKNSWS